MREFRQALRRLRRHPARAIAMTLTLGVGVGAVTAAFAAVDGVLLRDLPVREQDEIVVAWHDAPARDFLHIPFRPVAWEVAARGVESLSSVSGVESAGARPVAVEGAEGADLLRHVRVAGDFFGTLGADPTVGRLLTASDDLPGAAPVVVLSHGAWTSRYGADPGALGSVLRYGDRSYTVVGVAPEGFDFPRGTQLWATLRGAYPEWEAEEPVGIELDLVGRLAPGAGPATVRADLEETLGADPVTAETYGTYRPVVQTLPEHLFGAQRPVLRVALAGASVLLLAAVANVALLLLSGGTVGVRELAIRRALGAGRGRVLARILGDAGAVGAVGLALGIALAWLALRTLLPLAPAELSRLDQVGLDPRTGGLAVGVALLATLVAAAAAGLGLAGGSSRAGLTSGRRWTRPGAGLRRTVAGVQIALTVVAGVVAGLLLRTVAELDRLEMGFDTERLHVVAVRAPYTWFEVPEAWFATLEETVRELEGRAGIVAARPTLAPPLVRGLEAVLQGEGQSPEEVEENPYVVVDAVVPGHMEAMGIPLLRGRPLSDADNAAGADPVVVVNEAAARALWPAEDPLGRWVSGFPPGGTRWTVVGVAADTRYREVLEARPVVYHPMRRLAVAPPMQLLVRTAPGGPDAVRGVVEEVLTGLDPAASVLGEEPVVRALRRPTARPRFAAGVLLSFAAATLLLAALGVYGVFTVWVQERTREMGVRRALGSPRSRIAALVLGGTMRVALVGIVAGVLVALPASRLVTTLLYEVPPTDAGTFAGVAFMALATALAAALVPALKASATDPAVSLRAE